MDILSKLAQKLNFKNEKSVITGMSDPICGTDSDGGNEFLKKMSKHALKLHEKQCDIKNFTKLVLSDPENTSHNEIVEQLLKEDVLDPLSDKVIEELSNNKELWDDLGL